mmetsp:Transcript_57673/g.163769  ORF Transcript_57673/g.163769 Transcript_57673/m.163769 type:complete len:281 (-) Transcript_57673:1780-2622(-)
MRPQAGVQAALRGEAHAASGVPLPADAERMPGARRGERGALAPQRPQGACRPAGSRLRGRRAPHARTPCAADVCGRCQPTLWPRRPWCRAHRTRQQLDRSPADARKLATEGCKLGAQDDCGAGSACCDHGRRVCRHRTFLHLGRGGKCGCLRARRAATGAGGRPWAGAPRCSRAPRLCTASVHPQRLACGALPHGLGRRCGGGTRSTHVAWPSCFGLHGTRRLAVRGGRWAWHLGRRSARGAALCGSMQGADSVHACRRPGHCIACTTCRLYHGPMAADG